ncbi:hypothetical protein M9H77_03980 [Catharanthus roseus]|uniref:Uncharacterized protein n=1 Tax=Catharanthus roseus TaxID=4058 RepID=A0ACC0CD31_CATRO|nr:hypothetical protein M9H77_03980 [Catharanthus roseus]
MKTEEEIKKIWMNDPEFNPIEKRKSSVHIEELEDDNPSLREPLQPRKKKKQLLLLPTSKKKEKQKLSQYLSNNRRQQENVQGADLDNNISEQGTMQVADLGRNKSEQENVQGVFPNENYEMDIDLVQEDTYGYMVERGETSGRATRSKRPANDDEGILDGVNDELSDGVSDSEDETVECRGRYKNFNAKREIVNAPHPRQWHRALFSMHIKADMLRNNLCESVNSFILEARNKPIIKTMESIRVMLMERIQDRRTKMLRKPEGGCRLKIQEIIERHGYQVSEQRKMQFIVALRLKNCTREAWALSGILCPYTIATIHKRGWGPYEDVDKYYSEETFMNIYDNVSHPINGEAQWPEGEGPGRPKKLRKRQPKENDREDSEPQRIRRRIIIHCITCKKARHNKKACKEVEGDTFIHQNEAPNQNNNHNKLYLKQQYLKVGKNMHFGKKLQMLKQPGNQEDLRGKNVPNQPNQEVSVAASTEVQTARNEQPASQTRKTSKPRGRFKNDNRDRKYPNKFKSVGSTMKKKFYTGQKGKCIQCRECEGYGHIIQIHDTTLSDEDKKSDFEDDEEDTNSNKTLTFNVIIDLEDTFMHIDYKDDNNDDFIYSDKEVSYEKLHDKYNLAKWVGPMKLHQDLKGSLKKV